MGVSGEFDLGACVLGVNYAVTRFDCSGAGDDIPLGGTFLGRGGEKDSAGSLFLRLDVFDENAIADGGDRLDLEGRGGRGG